MKKLYVLLVFSLSIITFNSAALTNVSGFINANTTWDLSGSPYIVTGNALLSHGYTLTINPGVVIKFDSAKALQIDGTLIAIGTPQSRITFTSNKAIPQAGDWASIHFADTCIDAAFDVQGNYLSGCIMKYCDVLYGGGLGNGEVYIESSNPYFTNCRIMNSGAAGIYSDGSAYIFDSSSVKNCVGYGMNINGYDEFSCDFNIENDSIESNANGGISLTSKYISPLGCTNMIIKIANNYFSSNAGLGAINNIGMYGYASIIISNNYFIHNSGRAVIGNSDSDPLLNYTIKCNKFINNNCFQGCIENIEGDGPGKIINNTFTNNTGNSISVVNLGLGYDPYQVYFEGNYISNNTSQSGSCCLFTAYNINPNSFLSIGSNQFINNSGTNIVEIGVEPQTIGTYNFVEMKNNNFTDPGQIELYNNIPYGSPNIYADSNYWGGTSTQHIDSAIYDYFDYANQSVVYYLPILNMPVEIDTVCSASVLNAIPILRQESTSIIIYPNPVTKANPSTTISFSEQQKNTTITITDILGKLIYTATAKETASINITLDNPPGMYFVKVITESADKPTTTKVFKLIKE